MKSIKRIVLATIFAIGAIILVACSGAAKSDNGTYVYEASKDLSRTHLRSKALQVKKQKNTLINFL